MIDGEPTKGAILMKKFVRIIAFMLLLTLFCSTALAQAPDAIPLKDISATQVEPPPEIRQVLGIGNVQQIGRASCRERV